MNDVRGENIEWLPDGGISYEKEFELGKLKVTLNPLSEEISIENARKCWGEAHTAVMGAAAKADEEIGDWQEFLGHSSVG